MEIREAHINDLPEIIEVLKASLGEKDLPISEDIWHYKHICNPFGKSVVLLAIEDEQVIGVRAFMRWAWQNGDQGYSALRAVDTATHPEHQGKGVFKRLTLRAVDICKEKGDTFIFNTPNDRSRPGYLKMGWEIAGKIEVGLKPSLFSFWKISTYMSSYEINRHVETTEIEKLCDQWNEYQKGRKKLFTPRSAKFLNWRYENNPLQEYEVLATPDFYLAAYIKRRGRMKELRISEYITNVKKPEVESMVKKTIRKWCSKFGVQVVSYSSKLQRYGKFSITGGFGPILTVKNLNLSIEEKSSISDIQNWNYSIGDLELF